MADDEVDVEAVAALRKKRQFKKFSLPFVMDVLTTAYYVLEKTRKLKNGKIFGRFCCHFFGTDEQDI